MTDGEPIPGNDAPPSLFDRMGAVIRQRARPLRLPEEARRTLAILLGAAISSSLLTACSAWLLAGMTERRVAESRAAAGPAAVRREQAGALAARFRAPGLDARLTMLARIVPQDARLVRLEDRRIVLRTADPDRLRMQLRAGGGGFRERGQTIAPDGGMDVTLESAP